MANVIVTNQFLQDIRLNKQLLVFKCELGGRLVDYSFDSISSDSALLTEYTADQNQTFPILYTYYPSIRSSDRYDDVVPVQIDEVTGKITIKLPTAKVKLDAYKTLYLSYCDVDTKEWKLGIAIKLSGLDLYNDVESIITFTIQDIQNEHHCNFITSGMPNFISSHTHQTNKAAKYRDKNYKELPNTTVANIPDTARYLRKEYQGYKSTVDSFSGISIASAANTTTLGKIDADRAVLRNNKDANSEIVYSVPQVTDALPSVDDINIVLTDTNSHDIYYKNLYRDMPVLYQTPSNPKKESNNYYINDTNLSRYDNDPKISENNIGSVSPDKFVWGSINRKNSFDTYIRSNTEDINSLFNLTTEETILIKTGNHISDSSNEIDLKNVRYVKGEWPNYVYIPNATIKNYENTKFDNVSLVAKNAEIDDYKVQLKYTCEKSTEDEPIEVSLSDNCVVNISVKGSCYINFSNVKLGKTYVLWCKYGSYTHDVFINNEVANNFNRTNSNAICSGIENCISQVIFTGVENNGIIIESIIEGLHVISSQDILYKIIYPDNNYIWKERGPISAKNNNRVSFKLGKSQCNIRSVTIKNITTGSTVSVTVSNDGYEFTMPDSPVKIECDIVSDTGTIIIPDDGLVGGLVNIDSLSYMTANGITTLQDVKPGEITVDCIINNKGTWEQNKLSFVTSTKGCTIQYASLGNFVSSKNGNTYEVAIPSGRSTLSFHISYITYYSSTITKKLWVNGRYSNNRDSVISNPEFTNDDFIESKSALLMPNNYHYFDELSANVVNATGIVFQDNIIIKNLTDNTIIPVTGTDMVSSTDTISGRTYKDLANADSIVSDINNNVDLSIYTEIVNKCNRESYNVTFVAPDSNVRGMVIENAYKVKGYESTPNVYSEYKDDSNIWRHTTSGYKSLFTDTSDSTKFKYGLPIYKFNPNSNNIFEPNIALVDTPNTPVTCILLPEYNSDCPLSYVTMDAKIVPAWGTYNTNFYRKGKIFRSHDEYVSDSNGNTTTGYPHYRGSNKSEYGGKDKTLESTTYTYNGVVYDGIPLKVNPITSTELDTVRGQPIASKVSLSLGSETSFGETTLFGTNQYVLVFKPPMTLNTMWWADDWIGSDINRGDILYFPQPDPEIVKKNEENKDREDYVKKEEYTINPSVRYNPYQIYTENMFISIDNSVSFLNECGAYYDGSSKKIVTWHSKNRQPATVSADKGTSESYVKDTLENDIPSAIAGKGVYIDNGDNSVKNYRPYYYNLEDTNTGRLMSNGTSGVVRVTMKSIPAKYYKGMEIYKTKVYYLMGKVPEVKYKILPIRKAS